MEYFLFVILGVASSLVSAIFGFGTALIVLAIGAHILPVKETIVLATIMFSASNITKTWLFSEHIDWKTAGIVAFGCLPFAYLGAGILFEAPIELIRRLLGVMILAYVGLTSLRTLPNLPINTPILVVGSAVYGFVSGLLGSGNLVKVIFFRELNFDKESFVGIMATTAILVNIVKLFAYYKMGLLTSNLYVPSVFLVIGAFLMAFIGRYYLHKISSKYFQSGIKVILVISAFGLLL